MAQLGTADKKKILMIDDDKTLLKLFEMTVEAHQDMFELLTAENTAAGDRLARQQHPDVILLDLILGSEPGVSIAAMDKIHGFNFLMMLKRDPKTADIPIILLTAKTVLNHTPEAFFFGLYAALSKPFTKWDLIHTVNEILHLTDQTRVIKKKK